MIDNRYSIEEKHVLPEDWRTIATREAITSLSAMIRQTETTPHLSAKYVSTHLLSTYLVSASSARLLCSILSFIGFWVFSPSRNVFCRGHPHSHNANWFHKTLEAALRNLLDFDISNLHKTFTCARVPLLCKNGLDIIFKISTNILVYASQPCCPGYSL